MSISTAWPPFTRVNDQNVFLGWVVIVVQDQLHICLSKVLNIVTSVHGSSEPQFCMFVFRYSLGSTFWDIQYVLKCQQRKKKPCLQKLELRAVSAVLSWQRSTSLLGLKAEQV